MSVMDREDMRDLRSLLVSRLATVDQRHRESGQRERDRIKSAIQSAIGSIDKHGPAEKLQPLLKDKDENDGYQGDY